MHSVTCDKLQNCNLPNESSRDQVFPKLNLLTNPNQLVLDEQISDLDASLDIGPWNVVDSSFGPHTIDLMAFPSNVKLDRSGRPLKFFSPFPSVQAQGTNVFSQVFENAFVFPPFTLIGPLLKFLTSQPCLFTLTAPDVSPRKYWWPLLQRQATVAFKLGQKGDNTILLFPAKTGHSPWESRPLQWDLWVFRFAALQ